MMSNWNDLRVGKDILGFVKIMGCDNYHILGRFRAGPNYSIYAGLLEQVYHQQDSKEYLDMLEKVNHLDMQLVESSGKWTQAINDFQLEDLSRLRDKEGVPVEFKFKIK